MTSASPIPVRPVRRSRRGAALALVATLLVGGLPAARSDADPTAELQDKINAAIDKGANWLETNRHADGSFDPVVVNNELSHQIGMTSLCALALLAAGKSRKDPQMVKTLEWVRTQDGIVGRGGTRATYDAGIMLMFAVEMYRPEEKGEKEKSRYAKAKVKDPCGLPKDVREWMEDVARWFGTAQLEDGWWRYPNTPPGDLSNTQYALLGLRAAHDCGVAVSPQIWMKAIEGTLDAQEKDGPKMMRIIPGSGKPGEGDYATKSPDRARGFPYQRGEGKSWITGSMTTAGIAALAICNDALLKPERWGGYTDDLQRKVGQSVQDGFAWLEKNFAVDKNPPAGGPAWHYYYLYGLERACAFANRPKVGKHDWYVEGAKLLVAQQKEDGRWSTGALGGDGQIGASDLCDTAWALLFLKKASRPTIEIRPPVVTQGD